jgi:hypothetical protein
MRAETLAEQLFFVTIKIETAGPSGLGSGTGFFFDYKDEKGSIHLIVTNKHVIQNADQGKLVFTKRISDQPAIGNVSNLIIENFDSIWFGHPDPDVDIAVCPLVPLLHQLKQTQGADIFYRTISEQELPTKDQLSMLDAVEDILFVGYPNGIWDSQNYLPVVRRGITASPLQVNFENAPRFLIDASVFGGSSGSPVFLYNKGMYQDRDGSTIIGSRFYFLGVVSAVFYKTEENLVTERFIPTRSESVVANREMLDLGIVFHSKTVQETAVAFAAANDHRR